MILRKAGLWLALFSFLSSTALALQHQGELRITVKDAAGYALPATITIISDTDAQKKTFRTDESGALVLHNLSFQNYQVAASAPGFASAARQVRIASEIPQSFAFTLTASAVTTTVDVSASAAVVDSDTGNAYAVPSAQLEEHIPSSAGRSVVDVVNAQPGWLVEANGTLHPRGSEYGVQFVQNGFPFTDNRSPAFSSSPNPEETDSLTVLTAAYPAEFGRKLGGVVESSAGRDDRRGLHGNLSADGGSFAAVEGSSKLQWATERRAIKFGLSGLRTDRYLDPPTEFAWNDAGRNLNVFGDADLDLDSSNNLRLAIWHGGSHFFVPNDLLQQQAGQQPRRENLETGGNVALRHIFTPRLLGSLRFMTRDISATLDSNAASTPIQPEQDRGFREIYSSASVSGQKGRHNWKAGADYVTTAVRESFSYLITDATRFDAGTAGSFQFSGQRGAQEESAFAQDNFSWRHFTASVGLRWDSYHLLVKDNAFSPRLGVSWQTPLPNASLYASYDRIFATPAVENLLLSSSPLTQSVTDSGTGLPVPPARGDFYQVGVRMIWFSRLRTNANFFVRNIRNFADDDVLLNTGVSFPISFAHAHIEGWETKIETNNLGRWSGFVSYSNQVGIGYLPITGGLLLDAEAHQLLSSTDRFPISQDQRNTVHGYARYLILKSSWIAADAYYGSGLPVETGGIDLAALSSIYSPPVLSRVNFERGRLRPSSSIDFSAGTTVWSHNERTLQLQGSVSNVFDHLNLINFAGLLSGTAVDAPRHYGLRMRFAF